MRVWSSRQKCAHGISTLVSAGCRKCEFHHRSGVAMAWHAVGVEELQRDRDAYPLCNRPTKSRL